jgi:hypothetical protein
MMEHKWNNGITTDYDQDSMEHDSDIAGDANWVESQRDGWKYTGTGYH